MGQTITSQRPRVLLVEDEFIIAMDLAETVQGMGFAIDGPHRGKDSALASIDEAMPDFAILDIFLDDGEVYPLADILTEAGVPIIFHSGHVPPAEVSSRYPMAQAAAKPCPPNELISMMQGALETSH